MLFSREAVTTLVLSSIAGGLPLQHFLFVVFLVMAILMGQS